MQQQRATKQVYSSPFPLMCVHVLFIYLLQLKQNKKSKNKKCSKCNGNGNSKLAIKCIRKELFHSLYFAATVRLIQSQRLIFAILASVNRHFQFRCSDLLHLGLIILPSHSQWQQSKLASLSCFPHSTPILIVRYNLFVSKHPVNCNTKCTLHSQSFYLSLSSSQKCTIFIYFTFYFYYYFRSFTLPIIFIHHYTLFLLCCHQ